jgi:hypothetical protein
MADMQDVTKTLRGVNEAALTTTLIVTAIGGLITTIRSLVGKAREEGVDVGEFEVAIAGFDAALASVETKSAEYNRLRDEQRAAEAAETDPGTAPSAPVS